MLDGSSSPTANEMSSFAGKDLIVAPTRRSSTYPSYPPQKRRRGSASSVLCQATGDDCFFGDSHPSVSATCCEPHSDTSQVVDSEQFLVQQSNDPVMVNQNTAFAKGVDINDNIGCKASSKRNQPPQCTTNESEAGLSRSTNDLPTTILSRTANASENPTGMSSNNVSLLIPPLGLAAHSSAGELPGFRNAILSVSLFVVNMDYFTAQFSPDPIVQRIESNTTGGAFVERYQITISDVSTQPGASIEPSATEPSGLSSKQPTPSMELAFTAARTSVDPVMSNSLAKSTDPGYISADSGGVGSKGRVGKVYERPSTDEVVRVAKSLDNLDTEVLRARVKEVLRQNGVSQRLFGEVILGMCQASVSDMLSKPRAWSQLTEKARLPYVRMHIWLNQPDRMDALRGGVAPTGNTTKCGARGQLRSVDANSEEDVPVMKCTNSPIKVEHESLENEPSECTPLKLRRMESTEPGALSHTDSSLSESLRPIPVTTGKTAPPDASGVVTHTGSEPTLTIPSTGWLAPPLENGTNGSDNERDAIGTDTSTKQSAGRNRVVFTPAQKETLLIEFTRQPYPTSNSLRALAQQLNLPYKPVVNWFHNRRMRSRQSSGPMLTKIDKSTSDIIHDLVSDVTHRELPALECSEYFSNVGDQKRTYDLHFDACTSMGAAGAQANRRKRRDPARLVSRTGSVTVSNQSDLIDPV
ncbi:unnamed protein product [Echinostoma caproni]|uniref:One cut domain family member n=1 Tax=Echinostoma caproni TaxID=27848 RepID=A0A183AJA8_9TREM|nr:unnamed protein product [Echinostoma caproni]